MKEKICLALDVSSRKEAMDLVRSLRDLTGMFKVGMQLFTAEGPSLIREIIGAGGKVFLDLKFHDIPNTVKSAAVEAAKLGVSMMTIHTAGGTGMMQAVAREPAREVRHSQTPGCWRDCVDESGRQGAWRHGDSFRDGCTSRADGEAR